jgi:hypothetical protein
MAVSDILTYSTNAREEAQAVDELVAHGAMGPCDVAHRPSQDGLTVLFITTGYDLGRLGKLLAKASRRHVIGAVTGCAIGPGGFLRHGITGFCLPAPRFMAVDALIEDVTHFGLPEARKVAASLRAKLKRVHPSAPNAQFALVLIDSGARCEERLMAALGMEFAGLPIVGGSAGDVYFNLAANPPGSKRLLYKGRAVRNAAVFILVASQSPVMALTHNHYRASTRKIVITQADPDRRLVREINGRPALAEFSAACGFRKPPSTVAQYASHPLMIRVGGQYFARGVQRLLDDGSIEFACAIEAGVVAAIGTPDNMVDRLEGMFADVVRTVGRPDLVIGFECAARTVCMEQGGMTAAVTKAFELNHVVGFSAIGEQFNTAHVNNSFTALAVGAGR